MWTAVDQLNPSLFIVTWQVKHTDMKITFHFRQTFDICNSKWLALSFCLSCVLVFLPEDKTWVVIQHNNTELTRIQSSSDRNQHFARFDYSSEEEQLASIISQSEHCEQELSFHCRRSRLFNSLGKGWEKKALWHFVFNLSHWDDTGSKNIQEYCLGQLFFFLPLVFIFYFFAENVQRKCH